MKKITLFLLLFFCVQMQAQSIVIGTGTVSTAGTGSDPVDGYFESFRYQIVYTAAELSASLTPYDQITALGFSIDEDYGGGLLYGYTIKMGHTTATNSASHNFNATTVVKNSFDYDPTETVAGDFDMINFDTPFIWNGVDNIVIEICSEGPNAFTDPYGGVRATAMTNGSRRYRVDGDVACNTETGTTSANRPNIKFNYTEGTPPTCLPPFAGLSTVTSSTTANLSWTSGGATNFEVVVQLAGLSIPATANDTGVNVTGNSYSASLLLPQTAYEFYVRGECTDGADFSTWAGPYTFNTTQVPGCATNLTPADGAIDVLVPSSVLFSWDAPTTGDPAESYDMYYGLTPGSANIFVGNYLTTSATIDVSGYGTTFYWKIVPKNIGGSSIGCAEWSFTTIDAPGYCLDAPNGQWPSGVITPDTCDGLTENIVTENGYAGEYSLVNVTAGQTYVFKSSIPTDLITISSDDGVTATAYGPNPVTWVADVTGEVRFYTHLDEQCGADSNPRTRSVVCGLPPADSPDYVNLQWPPSATIPQGGSFTVYGQIYEAGLTEGTNGQAAGINAWVGYSTSNTNPNSWSNWIPATFNIETGPNNNNDEYMVTFGDALPPGTYYYATRFNLNAGGYVYGGINATNDGNFWDGTTYLSGVLTVLPPPAPANDNCTDAIALTVGGVYGDHLTDGTNLGATNSTQADPTTCFGYAGGDVWYSVVVPASGSLTIETGDSSTGETGLDTVITVYSGDCTTPIQVGCDDDGADTGSYSFLSLTGQTPGATLLIRVYEYNNDGVGGFGISAYDASLSSDAFNSSNFNYYPNPVKNILNLTYAQGISTVEVFNLLGQKVISNKCNDNQAQIDMSNLSDGAYMVRVTSKDQVKTLKVIKQ
ncbi:T9SS type A sorting domain-containing protein [Flavobacterium sp. XGLA_31]|uniref:T9SS type A sorting domain-containing protein n=1 Tax=Flavobacterium sp. XGLA_31 TaxID=3447666 RepID=UPI003F317E33